MTISSRRRAKLPSSRNAFSSTADTPSALSCRSHVGFAIGWQRCPQESWMQWRTSRVRNCRMPRGQSRDRTIKTISIFNVEMRRRVCESRLFGGASRETLLRWTQTATPGSRRRLQRAEALRRDLVALQTMDEGCSITRRSRPPDEKTMVA
jgi:hypothetical protein